MKKYYLIILFCVLLIISGCSTKYKRIHFNGSDLGETLEKYISEETNVVYAAPETFEEQLPIYKITERNISDEEAQQILEQLGVVIDPSNETHSIYLKGNELICNWASYTDTSRGWYAMTDEELEVLAWENFNKIPFLEGEYEYIGIRETTTITDLTGDHVSRVGVHFCRLLDGIRVLGDEKCVLYFDGSGLCEIQIRLYTYEKIGMMDMVTLEDAKSKITSPDGFVIDPPDSATSVIATTLQVERTKLYLMNQHFNGCTILQPIYNFVGTAILSDGTEVEFQSRVIAIPESYTYQGD